MSLLRICSVAIAMGLTAVVPSYSADLSSPGVHRDRYDDDGWRYETYERVYPRRFRRPYVEYYDEEVRPRRYRRYSGYERSDYVDRYDRYERVRRYDRDDREDRYDRDVRADVEARAAMRPSPTETWQRTARQMPRAAGCVPVDRVRARLQREGWSAFRDVALQGEIAVVHARAASGRQYELRIERCSGQLVGARLAARAISGSDRQAPPPVRRSY